MKVSSPRSTDSEKEGQENKDQRDVDITWNDALEKLLCEEAEKCSGLAWLHTKSELFYTGRNNLLQIPIIVLSTITGAASVGSSTLFPGRADVSSVVLGGVSILVSVLGMLSSHYSFSKRAEGHKLGSIQYAQIHRTINIEMSLPRDQRMHPKQLLRFIKDDLKRLMENIPRVPENIIAEYKNTIIKDDGVSHPDITNGVHRVSAYVIQDEAAPAFTVRIRAPPPSNS